MLTILFNNSVSPEINVPPSRFINDRDNGLIAADEIMNNTKTAESYQYTSENVKKDFRVCAKNCLQ